MPAYLVTHQAARRDGERGASAVEYGLLVAGVALACILALQGFSLTLGGLFREQTSRVSACDGMTSCPTAPAAP